MPKYRHSAWISAGHQSIEGHPARFPRSYYSAKRHSACSVEHMSMNDTSLTVRCRYCERGYESCRCLHSKMAGSFVTPVHIPFASIAIRIGVSVDNAPELHEQVVFGIQRSPRSPMPSFITFNSLHLFCPDMEQNRSGTV